MNVSRFTLLAALLLPALSVRAQFHVEPDPTEVSVSGRTPETIILSWPAESYRLCRAMIEKYGQPAEARDSALIWTDNGQWKKTVVHRYPPAGRVFRRSAGGLEQSASYRVPPDKLEVLARFDREIRADAAEGRLIARSSSETENFLALNLARDVIEGKRTVPEAIELRRNLARLHAAGKSSPYLDGLLFAPAGRPTTPESSD